MTPLCPNVRLSYLLLLVTWLFGSAFTLAAPNDPPASRSVGTPQRLTWRLENPFPFFVNPARTSEHRRAFLALSGDQAANSPILSEERRLQLDHGQEGWAANVFRDTCQQIGSNASAACKNYLRPNSHKVIVEWVRSARTEGNCQWIVTGALNDPLQTSSGPCRNPPRLDIPYPSGATVEVRRRRKVIAKLFIQVEDLLIVGLGDSIGSGEGNPDKPVRFDDRKTLNYGNVILASKGWLRWPTALSGYPERSGAWRNLFDAGFENAGADWLDRRCHRSLYSYQLRAALQLAVENDQRAVTFLGLACTGAETLEGVFLQSAARECIAGDAAQIPAQLNVLTTALCRSRPSEAPLNPSVSRLLGRGKLLPNNPTIQQCGKGDLIRQPDLILLSLGGNDVGFSEMIADAILNRRSFYRQLANQMDAVHDAKRGAEKLKFLPDRYLALALQLEAMFGWRVGEQPRVMLTSYPDMGHREDGETVCKGGQGMDVFPAFSLDEAKAKSLVSLEDYLTSVLRTASAGYGWTFVDAHRSAFKTHGMCAKSPEGPEFAENLSIPRFRATGWSPYRPSLFNPYTSRTRWVRTPNDAFMTVNYHQHAFGRTTCTDLRRLVYNPFQLFLAGTYGGAFHPTAEGQAVIADAVAKQARDVLNRKQTALH